MDRPWHEKEACQNKVQPEMQSQADRQECRNGGQKQGDDNADKVHDAVFLGFNSTRRYCLSRQITSAVGGITLRRSVLGQDDFNLTQCPKVPNDRDPSFALKDGGQRASDDIVPGIQPFALLAQFFRQPMQCL